MVEDRYDGAERRGSKKEDAMTLFVLLAAWTVLSLPLGVVVGKILRLGGPRYARRHHGVPPHRAHILPRPPSRMPRSRAAV
jgi:hypothetical protein